MSKSQKRITSEPERKKIPRKNLQRNLVNSLVGRAPCTRHRLYAAPFQEPSVRVRENASEQLEERQSDWAYSKSVLVLDMLWNFAFIGVGLVVLGLSVEERPIALLKVWVVGQYWKEMGFGESGTNLNLNSSSTSGSGSDGEDYGIEKPGWGRNQGRPVLTMLSLSLLFLLLFALIYLLFNMRL